MTAILTNHPDDTTARKVRWATAAAAISTPLALLAANWLAGVLPALASAEGHEAVYQAVQLLLTAIFVSLPTWATGYMVREEAAGPAASAALALSGGTPPARRQSLWVSLSGALRAILSFWRVRPRARGTAVAGTAATVVTIAAATIAPWEGLRTEAYLDPVGIPTLCYGETRGVQLGDSATEAECREMLQVAVADFNRQLGAIIDDDIEARVPPKTRAALVSWAYNVGTGAAARSTLIRKLNAGDFEGACRQLPRWNKAGGRVLRGLTRRRAAEMRLCLEGLAEATA